MSGATIDYSKLQIVPDFDTQEWWAAAKEHKYMVRQCKDCGHKFFPPVPICGKCQSMNLGWFQTAGKGVIHSYIVVVQPILAAFVPAVPYVVAVIELDDCKEADGTLTRVAGVLLDDDSAAAIGLPVTVQYEASNDPKFDIPRWKISGTAQDTWRFTE